jgi:hypothetical protein
MLEARSAVQNVPITPAEPGQESKTSLNKLVRDALEQSDNNIHDATEMLLEWVNDDESIAELIWKELVPRALLQACRDEVHLQRSKIAESQIKERYQNQRSSPEPEKDKVRRKAGMMRMLMDWPLADGRPLCRARGDELHETIKRYDKQAQEMSHRARWLRLIAQRAGSKVVGKAMKEEDLQELWDNC